MVHSVAQIGMYVTGHHWMNPTDFGECRIYNFFIGVQKNSYTF